MGGGDRVRPGPARGREPGRRIAGGGSLSPEPAAASAAPRRPDPPDPSDERASIEGFLASRDELSFRRLYRLHSPSLYRVIVRTLGSPDLAEDVLQETWIRAVHRLGAFRGASSLRTWLTGIAIRCGREALRRTGPAPGGEPPETAAGPRPGGLRLDLERAVAALPDGRREIVVLHDVEGFTHAEIAAILGIDEGTSKSQLSRARRLLRELLGDTAAPSPPRPGEPVR